MRVSMGFSSILLASMFGCHPEAGTTDIPEVAAESNPAALFEHAAGDLGISFRDSPKDLDNFPLPAVMGSGCAIADFDRNGRLDILLLAQNSLHKNVALYCQNAEGEFEDRTTAFQLDELSGTGVAVADCNNDSWPDIYITSTHQDTLWLNIEGRSFRNLTADCGIVNSRWGTAACWLDYDRDGWLDLFVTNYVTYQQRPCTRLGGGDRDFCSPVLFERTSDILYRNVTAESDSGEPRFHDVSVESGIAAGQSAGLGVTAADFTADGQIDIYVASDQHPNILWVNTGAGFVDEAALRGCDLDFQGNAQASMGLALGDLTSSQSIDILVAHLDGESHAAYHPREHGLFTDICRETGIAAATRPLTGFGIATEDFDGDGSDEIITANGRVRRKGVMPSDKALFWMPYQQPLQLLTKDSDTDVYESKQLDNQQHVARGLATGDLDRDGDPDIVISTIGEPAVVLRNNHTSDRHWLTLRLTDPALGNRSCPGAIATIDLSDNPRRRVLQPCQSYASTHADEVSFAVDPSVDSVTVTINWPHGDTQAEVFTLDLSSNMTATLQRGAGVILD